VAAEGRPEWRCPRCRGTLVPPPSDAIPTLECTRCSATYPVVDGIPDLRVPDACAIDLRADTEVARALALEADALSLEDLVRRALSSRSPREWTQARLDLRTRQSLEGPERMRAEVRDWLRPCLEGAGPVLDAGCGFGGLIAAAAAEGIEVVGVDASLLNLVVARRLLAARGQRARLAAALVEHLPLADASLSALLALDVVEHVGDAGRFLAEAARVTRGGGRMALSTPNRFSLAAEPHVSVWGVGWLPRPWQPAYVRWRSGIDYRWVQLLGPRELRRRVEAAGFACEVRAPAVPEAEMAAFSPRRRALARVFNAMRRVPGLGRAVGAVAPFLRVLARRAGV